MNTLTSELSRLIDTLPPPAQDPLLYLVAAVMLIVSLSALHLRRERGETTRLEAEIKELRSQLQQLREQLPAEAEAAPATAEVTTVHAGLSKTRRRLFGRWRELFQGKESIGAEEYNALEELLITSDLGVQTATELLEQLKEEAKEKGGLDENSMRESLKGSIREILAAPDEAPIKPVKRDGAPMVILIVGVNGVGKTTTIGKLAQRFSAEGAKVLLGAGDTFRAAAVEQLQAWGRRVGVDVVSGREGAKPATVAYETIEKAKEGNYDVVLFDTAGRLHTRVNLMNELGNIVKILSRELPGSPHETLLVLDATTGQNALQQAREFNQVASLTGIVITKLDGTPKGGIVVAVKRELGIPIRYIGVGEGAKDLKPFSADEFIEAMFDDGELTDEGSAAGGSDGQPRQVVRRRRERAYQ